MEELEPLGSVYQAGTFSGNPVTMAGGIATLKLLADKRVYEILEIRTSQLFTGLQSLVDENDYPVQLQRVGSLFAILFSSQPVHDFADSQQIDAHQFAKFFRYALENGIYLPPSSVDAACVSAAHSNDDIRHAVSVLGAALDFVFTT